MQNPRLASVYAKSLADLAVEQNSLDTVYADVQYLDNLCQASRELVLLLKSPIVVADKKQSILTEITKGNISELTSLFITLLIKKGRESFLPQIIKAFIAKYYEINGIHSVKITTAVPMTDGIKTSILSKLKQEAGFDKIDLETSVDADLIGGFVLEFNNNLVDASITRDLRDIKKQFQQNLYTSSMN